MRGKPGLLVLLRLLVRIIPAHAGQTQSGGYPRLFIPDHPRACGANDPLNVKDAIRDGSSPRMRGKLRPSVFMCHPVRIIPAHAGQTNQDGRTGS